LATDPAASMIPSPDPNGRWKAPPMDHAERRCSASDPEFALSLSVSVSCSRAEQSSGSRHRDRSGPGNPPGHGDPDAMATHRHLDPFTNFLPSGVEQRIDLSAWSLRYGSSPTLRRR
jgi:hypothetical protein